MSVPRARRKRTYLRADDRRAQILDVAKAVFAERGYHEANVADICAAARIGRGTLYQYFDNKRDVLLAVIEDIVARIRDVLARRPPIEPVPGMERTPAALVVAFCKKRVREMLDAIFQDEATLRLLLRDARGLDGAVDEMLARVDEALLGALERDLRAAASTGLMRAVDPRLAALYILGGVEKIVLAALASNDPVDLDRIVDVAVDLELFGLLNEEVRR